MARYDDLILANGEYVPQYAGAPLEAVRQTADTLSTRHYQNLAKLNQLELVAEQYKSKMLPGAKPYVDQHINDIGTALQDIAANGGENATARVAAIGNKFLGDQGVLAGLQTSEAVNKEIELENQLLAQNKTPIRKRGVRESVMNAPVIDPATGKLNAPYASPYQSTVTQYENPVPHMEQIWDIIKPDSIEGALKGADGLTMSKLLGESMVNGLPDLPMFFESLTRAGIGKGKIDSMLNNAWSSYKQTPAFKQAVEYAGDPIAEEKRQKDQFYKHGLLRTFQNIQRQYVGNNLLDDFLKAGKKAEPGTITQAPGNTVETLFPYDEDGKAMFTSPNVEMKDYSERLLGSGSWAMADTGYKQSGFDNKSKEFSPQYLKDVNAMSQIKGVAAPKPETPEARALAKEYRQTVETRVSHPTTIPYTKDEGLVVNYNIQSQFGLYQYMDPATGEVFTPFDNKGQMTDEFKKITGGDPNTFRLESQYDAKNHYSSVPGSNNNFVKPMAVVGEAGSGDDKVQKRFIISQMPLNTSQKDINTNVIYNKVNLYPGQTSDVHPRVKARELHGNQFTPIAARMTDEERKKAVMPIEATIDGKTYIFHSPENLAEYLESQGINLTN